MSETLTSMFEQQEIDVIMGKGKLVDAHTIEVNNTTLQSDYIVIATGQHSHQLDIEVKNIRMIVGNFINAIFTG